MAQAPQEQGPQEQDSAFYSIVRQKDGSVVEKLQQLIDNGFDVHNLYNGQTTALHIASEFGNVHLVRYLLQVPQRFCRIRYAAAAAAFGGMQHASSDILRRDMSDGDTALHIAAIGGNLEVFQLLVDALPAEYDVNNAVNNHGMTPLHYAMGKGNIELAELLISRGGNLQQGDYTGATAFHFAARSGCVKCLELAGSPINECSNTGLTALHYAAWNGNVEATTWLLDKGAHLSKADLVEGGIPLHWAAMRGDKETVKKLIEAHVAKGIPVFSRMQKSGKTALELMQQHGRDHVKALLTVVRNQGLLDLRAFPEMVLVKHVIGYGDAEMVEMLEKSLRYAAAKKDAYATRLKALLQTGLMRWAAQMGNKDSLKLLMKLAKRQLRPEDLQSEMASALHLALRHSKKEFAANLADNKHCKEQLPEVIRVMKRFLENNEALSEILTKVQGVDMDKLRDDIPVSFWVFYEDKQNLAKFIDTKGIWKDIVNDQGAHSKRTALHWATLLGRGDMVSSLCRIDACRANLLDADGKPPFRVAVELKLEHIQKELSGKEDVRVYLDILYRDRQVFVDALNAILVGAALIASISFQGFLQPPLGFPDGFVAIGKRGIQAFWTFNGLSFFFGMASTLVAARGVLPMPDIFIELVVSRIRKALLAAAITLVLSIAFALLSFTAAGFAVLPSGLRHQKYMVATSAVGGAVCVLMLLWFLKGLQQLLPRSSSSSNSSSSSSSSGSSSRNGKVMDENNKDAEEWEGVRDDGEEQYEDEDAQRAYDVGANHSEYPWQDGLDKLHHIMKAPPTITISSNQC